MGSGKTTVGRELATLLDRRFIDLDAEIVSRQGRSIADIFRTEGEPRFREIESESLREALRHASPAVIALGGGTFVQPTNREILRAHAAVTVHLDGEFELLHARCCAEGGLRPLMQDAVHFRNLFEERRPLYREAEIVIAIENRTPREIAAEIAAQVEHLKGRPAVSE